MNEFAHNKRLVWGFGIVVVMLCIGLIVYVLQSSHILHRMTKSISPDGTIKYEIYDASLVEGAQKKKEKVMTIQEYALSQDGTEWKLLNETVLPGDYIGSSWSEDSRLFVVYADSEEGSLYLFDKQERYMRKLDDFLDMQLINKAALDSGLYHHILSVDSEIKYEFVQWAEHCDKMLIRYISWDKHAPEEENTYFEGYFWYNCLDNLIEGYMDATN